ncbi:MAG: hypothetical protein Q8L14_34860 [Myxococcales bacterium]|nr:hypothetical protein [Myxococcales bacterium]
MAVAKSVFIGLVALLGLGALALGVFGGLGLSASGPLPPVTVREIELRPFPSARAPLAAVPNAVDGGAEAPAAAVDAGSPAPAPAVVDAGVVKPPPPPPATKPDAGAPAVVRPPPPPPQPVGEGLLNLRSSDTADVFVDGKKVGGSPIEGLKVRAGAHKIRFDCYDAAGNTVPGTAKSVTVAADAEESVEFTCPVE